MYSHTLFLRIFAIIFGAFGVPVAFLNGLFSLQLLFVAVASVVLSIPIFLVVHFLGEKSANFLFGFGRKPGKREQMQSDYLRAKHYMASGNLIKAREIIKSILAQDPDFADALFVQAQIAMREGNQAKTRQVLKHIVTVTSKEDVNHQWALEYLRDMNAEYISDYRA